MPVGSVPEKRHEVSFLMAESVSNVCSQKPGSNKLRYLQREERKILDTKRETRERARPDFFIEALLTEERCSQSRLC